MGDCPIPSSRIDSVMDVNTLPAFGSPILSVHLTDVPMPSMPSLAVPAGGGGKAGNLLPNPTLGPGAGSTAVPSLGNNLDNSLHAAQPSEAHRQGKRGRELDSPSNARTLEECEEAPVSTTCFTRAGILIKIY